MSEQNAIVRSSTQKAYSLSWVVPIVAILITAFLFLRWWSNQGPAITITFENTAGLTIDSPIMYRGTIVGRVEAITLTSDTNRVEVLARLQPSAASLAKEGSQWWIVRPSVSLQGVQGLDTIVGPRYIEVLPSNGEVCFSFIGLQNSIPYAGKQISLVATSADNLTVGAPLYYRGVEVGQVTALDLADFSSTVRIICNVKERYAPLVRTNSKFWNISGISLDATLLGIDLRAGPLTSWIKGGIAFATPNVLGDVAPDGYAFSIEQKVDEDWIEWSPEIDLRIETGTQ